MAVTYAGHGGIVAAAAQTLNVTYPSGITAGDALVLTRAAKSENTVFVTPTGWTLLDDRAGGTGVLGNDTGQVREARYWREATGGETGTLTVDTSPGTVDVQQAVITRYTRAAGATWSVAASGGSDSTPGTDWSVTAAANPGITSGDLVEVGLSWPTDAARTWTNEVLTAAGATFATVMVPAVTATTSLGADMALRVHNYQCTTGTATAPPTYSATVNSGTNIAGPTSMVRLREVGGAGATVALTPATTAVTARPVTATPGPVTVTLTPTAVTTTARPVVAVPGPVTAPLAPAVVVVAGQPVVGAPGPVTTALNPAALPTAATPVTAAPGPVTVALSPAGTATDAPPVSAAPQPVTVPLPPAAAAVTGVPVLVNVDAPTGRGRVRYPVTSTARTPHRSGVRLL